jgi:hypothetical protein
MPPHAALMQILTAKWISSAVSAVAQFGIADHLEQGPKTIQQLAEATGTQQQALYRVLRACASIGIFAELEDGRFENTPLSEPLRTNAVPCVRHMAMMMIEDWHLKSWAELPWSMQTGEPAPMKVYGMRGFQYFSQNPEKGVIFNRAMKDISQADSPVIAASYDFSVFQSLVDVAGGLGTLLGAILDRTPSLHGIVFEMPHVVEQIQREGSIAKWAGRCEAVAGSFFEGVPKSDGYIMKHILHDWDDESASKILAACRKSILPGGKVLVVDQVVPAGNTPSPSKIMDLEMLVAPGGKERTAQEWDKVFTLSGLKLDRIILTPANQAIIEGSPI